MMRVLGRVARLILAWESRLLLRRHGPRVVAVAGSVGKTTAKDLIATVLKQRFEVRSSPANFNANVHVPLAVLGLPHGGRNPLAWIANAGRGLWRALSRDQPQWLVLEIAAGHPGEIRWVAGWLSTDVVVLTRFPEVPVHVGAFGSRERLLEEKSLLLETLGPTGTVVVNADDPDLSDAARRRTGERRITTFGLGDESEIRGLRAETVYDRAGQPLGMEFEVLADGRRASAVVPGIIGAQHLYAVLAAVAVGRDAGITADAALTSVTTNAFQPGRMRIRPGIRGSVVIDDAFNSSPAAADQALACLRSLAVPGKKVAVLGEMAELGDFADQEHRKLGALAAGASDLLLAAGDHADGIVEGALAAGLDTARVRRLNGAGDLIRGAEEHIAAGDVVLVKGRGLRTLVERIAAEPTDFAGPADRAGS